MKNGELIGKVHNSVYQQCQKRGYVALVDVLMDVGVLEKQKYEEWRLGKSRTWRRSVTGIYTVVFCYEAIQSYAGKNGLKLSFCYYKQWGAKRKRSGA